MSAEPLAAVTFDFWETLVQDSPENLAHARTRRIESMGRLLERAGCRHRWQALEEAHDRCGVEMTARFWAANRDPSIQDQVRLFFDCVESGLCDRLDAGMFAQAVEAYGSPAFEYPPDLMPGARDAVRGLAARGLRLGIVSNTGRTPGVVLRRILDRYDLLRYFDAVAISYSDEVGFRKPDARIFKRTLEALAVTPSRALHIGDNPDHDVAGARGFGMRTAHYAIEGRAVSPLADVVVSDLSDLPARLVPLLS
jgi:putative hydrolase of the HAD superfamily